MSPEVLIVELSEPRVYFSGRCVGRVCSISRDGAMRNSTKVSDLLFDLVVSDDTAFSVVSE